MSDSLWPHGLQHTRLPCPSPTLGASQIHAHQVGDAIQPSHLLSSSPPAISLSQHQGLFQWVSSLHQVAKVLQFQLQHQSVLPMNIQALPLGWAGWISLQPKGLFCKINKWISKATYTSICCLDLHMHVRINLRPNQPLVTLNLRFTFESNAFFCPQHLICVTVSPTHSFIQKYLLRTYYMSGNVCVLGIPWWAKLPPLVEPTF